MQNTQKNKILYIITKSNWGGAQRYVHDLAVSLPRERFDAVVVLGGEGLLKQKLNGANIRTISPVSLQRDVGIIKEIKTFFNFLKILREENPDVVHLNSSKAGAIGAFAARLYNLTSAITNHKSTIIFTAHGWAFNEDRPRWQKSIIRLIYWFTILLTHRTIAVSNTTRKQMAYLPFMEQKMTAIPNGVRPRTFFERNAARRKLAILNSALAHDTNGTLWVGMIAELHKTKGVAYAVEAFQHIRHLHPDSRLLIMGEGEEQQELESLITYYGLENHAVLLGFVEDAPSYLKALDIFLLTSISEALAYVILEAGQARLPVVATAVGGVPEIIAHRETGLLAPPRGVFEITSALSSLISDKTQRQRYADSLAQKVERKFVFGNTLRRTLSIYIYEKQQNKA